MILKPSRQLSRRAAAWTLIEMTVTVAVSSIIMAAVMQTSLFTSRSFVAMGNYNDLDRASRNCLDNMTRDIRQAKVFSDRCYATNYMVFTNLDNSYFGYLWDPRTKTVCRLTGSYDQANNRFVNARTNIMLEGCDFFSFRIGLRNPTNGFLFPYSAETSPLDTKLVDVSWRCSRRVLNQYNTESVQTAKIVLRN
jgi:type II secretory pathway pseudopilin PulG